ncbi:MAG TPA: amino acid ABC transporter ATP-binding protein [Fimbriiglobus sp.]
MIRVANLVKTHGPLRVLDGVNLDVREGEVTALVGPSGGGKSTLLRCINGLESFASGEVAVGNDLKLTGGKAHDTNALLALRRRVGMVFQQFNLFPHMTALENVMSGPVYALGQSKASARAAAEKLLARVGLAEKAGAKPATLSGGQQQRVAIARALAVNPRAMLFDEPTSALDPKMAGEVLAVMRDLAADGMTMIVVSHDTEFVRGAATVHRMEAGKIVQSGPPTAVLD